MEIVGERFEIEQLAGSGGMGHVFRARDRKTGKRVALKVVHSAAGAQELTRFMREAQALAAVRLPGVVRYIAHGATAAGQPYLAMEWLEGETLGARLGRQVLSIPESLDLAARVASTLGAVHRLGLIHRDLKPNNLLLVDGALDRVVLIDFGVVRISWLGQQLTVPGMVVGTPGYMAPEQVRGQTHIDARADVFALGCVIYRCLAGSHAFDGADRLAVLAKVVLEEPRPLRELREDVPEHLDRLIARMLSKSPEDRPADGMTVAAELAALDTPAAPTPTASVRAHGITSGERKVMCIVVARRMFAAANEHPERGRDEHTWAQELRVIASRYQGQIEIIEEDSQLVVLSGAGAPTDLAANAARCALAMQAVLGGAPVALVTGRAEIAGHLPVGDLVDRAVQLIPTRPGKGNVAGVRIDDVTAGLLGTRFTIAREDNRSWLQAAREDLDAAPQLLGKPTACVGRDRELSLLEGEWTRCVDDRAASAVVVTGAAGVGKSRLRREFVRALRERDKAVEIWIGQADAMSAGSTSGLLAHALRRAMGIFDDEPLEPRQRKVQAWVDRHRRLDAGRVASFLGELVGAPFPDEDDPQLRAARQNPRVMSEKIRLAWEDFIWAECTARPVLLVLDDLQWGDLPTMNLVDAALRQLQQRPFFVLALGRPEVVDLFPDLWDARRKQEIRLTPLPRRASERIVREALGDEVSAELVAKLVTRADGNAFFLEEQIRAAVSGKDDGVPETVLAMVQTRLEEIGAEARRVLRAASVFGETFWEGGVGALLGGIQVGPLLADLEHRDVVVRRPGGRFQGELEYRFRHPLVREAAYGMLTQRDLHVAHALAGDWLERAGETDPMTLAEHFERGGEPARAAAAYLRGARESLRGDDLGAAGERAERGIACAPPPAVFAALRAVQAEVHGWRGEGEQAVGDALEAVELLEPGAAAWFAALGQVARVTARQGSVERLEPWMIRARDVAPLNGAIEARGVCLGEGAIALMHCGRRELADALIEELERVVIGPPALGLEVPAKLHAARAVHALGAGDPGAALVSFEAAVAAHEKTGSGREACGARRSVGSFYRELGDAALAEKTLRKARADAARLGLHDEEAAASQGLAHALADLGRYEEARGFASEALTAFRRMGQRRMEGVGRCTLARILLFTRDPGGAEREARLSMELLRVAPQRLSYAGAVLSAALLAQGEARAQEAVTTAYEAVLQLEQHGAEEGESAIRLGYAEALATSGARPEAQGAIASARHMLLSRAEKIKNRSWRERFLRHAPENVRTLELAELWAR